MLTSPDVNIQNKQGRLLNKMNPTILPSSTKSLLKFQAFSIDSCREMFDENLFESLF